MDVTFDRDAIVAALAELVDELIRTGTQIQIRVVGGAATSVAFDRETTTTDVDALHGANPDIENAARSIAYRNGWPENWLNDNVKQFASHFDTAEDWINLNVRDVVAIRVAVDLFNSQDLIHKTIEELCACCRRRGDSLHVANSEAFRGTPAKARPVTLCPR